MRNLQFGVPVLFVIASITGSAPQPASAQFFIPPEQIECADLEGNFYAQKSCECSKTSDAVARLECFDEMTMVSEFLQSEANLTISRLLQDPYGRVAIRGACSQLEIK